MILDIFMDYLSKFEKFILHLKNFRTWSSVQKIEDQKKFSPHHVQAFVGPKKLIIIWNKIQ